MPRDLVGAIAVPLTILDLADRARPKLIAHRNWSPPYGGGTHSALPLPDRDLCRLALNYENEILIISDSYRST